VSNQYRKKPVVIEATQWLKNGDHPMVRPIAATDDLFFTGMGGAALIDREKYGVVGTLESPNHLVSPGDWIITGVKGELYPCKPDIFAATYEPVAKVDKSEDEDDKADSSALLPCPFCGPRTDDGESVVMLECREGNFVRGYTAHCDCCGIEVNGEYKSEVVAQWNTRTPVTPVPTIGDLNGTSPLPPAPEAVSADSVIATAGNPLARIDGADGEWLPRMWDLALAATDSEEHATAAALKMVAASHGYLVNWVRQEVPDELADNGSREILSAVGAPADAPVEGLLIGRAVDEDGIINWYASPVGRAALSTEGASNFIVIPRDPPTAQDGEGGARG
jgi:hypothetical protein